MFTVLDTNSWDKEQVSGNAEFLEISGASGSSTVFVVSNTRPATNSFVILRSNPVPPDPGVGYSFTQVAEYLEPFDTFTDSPNRDFGPVSCLDTSGVREFIGFTGASGATGVFVEGDPIIHIIGTRDNPIDPNLADLIKFTFDTSNNLLSSPITLATASRIRESYDICMLSGGHKMVAVSVDVEQTEFEAPQGMVAGLNPGVGESLIAFELDENDNVVSAEVLLNSPPRSGLTFNTVSLVSSDQSLVELYFVAHSKLVTFQDQEFTFGAFYYSPSPTAWTGPFSIYSWVGRFVEDRLTVVDTGLGGRVFAVTYYDQPSHPEGLVGSLVIGYYNSLTSSWGINIIKGSVANGSFIQACPSVAYTESPLFDATINFVYLLQPFNSQDISWPLKVASFDTTTLEFIDVPGPYNDARMTWLRGTKSIIDSTSLWAAVGEQEISSSPYSSVPVYLSLYNVPPVASLFPTAATVYRGASYYVINGATSAGDLVLSASGSTDLDLDNMEFVWTDNSSDQINVSITPQGSLATLNVDRAFGPVGATFEVGVAVIDLDKNGQGIHSALQVTNLGVTGGVLTATVANDLAVGEQFMLYNVSTGPSGPYLEQFNDKVYTIETADPGFLTAAATGSFPSTPVYGRLAPQFQFQTCTITIPDNAEPSIGATGPFVVPRNTRFTLSPSIFGMSDPDDLQGYTWTQTAGTLVTIVGGSSGPSLTFETNGVSTDGEIIKFQLVANDGVNIPVSRIFSVMVPSYDFSNIESDNNYLARSLWVESSSPLVFASIAERNSAKTWTEPGISALKTNLITIKRSSASDGSDRYLIISPQQVLVYGGIYPNMVLLRWILVPEDDNGYIAPIQDAFHTEDDVTLVLAGNTTLYRYSTAPLIQTDNPDVIFDLTTLTRFTFFAVTSKLAHGGVRVIVLSGPNGVLLIKVQNSSFQILGLIELSKEDGLVYGTNEVQFVRTFDVNSLNQGQIWLGTVLRDTAEIEDITWVDNEVTVLASNHFKVRSKVVLTGVIEQLNNVPLTIIAATPDQFSLSYAGGMTGATGSLGSSGLATSLDTGTCYETLIDLFRDKIIGTWDATKIRNQFVNTGEFLFRSETE